MPVPTWAAQLLADLWKNMSTSERKAAAHRVNSKKSHGPKNTTSTRFNATEHGLLALGLCELDDPESYRALIENLKDQMKPVGVLETFLVESFALDMMRLRRARRLEEEHITSELNPPENGVLFDLPVLGGPIMVDPGLPANIDFETNQRLALYQRYESAFMTKILRLLHELERMQRGRSGETLPAPAVLDVNLHASAEIPHEVPLESAKKVVDSEPARLGHVECLPPQMSVDGVLRNEPNKVFVFSPSLEEGSSASRGAARRACSALTMLSRFGFRSTRVL